MAYLYKIEEIKTGKLYIGIQLKSAAISSDILSSYFTSSSIVKKLIKENGKDSFKVVSTREGSKEYILKLESRYLRKLYSQLGKDTFQQYFYNKNINGRFFVLTVEEDKQRVEKSINTLKRLRTEGKINYHVGPINITKEERIKRSTRMLGNTFGKDRVITDIQRQHAADKSIGNTNVRGTTWWYQPQTFQYKRSFEQPDISWIKKGLPGSEKQKQTMSKMRTGLRLSAETKLKIGQKAKQRPSNNKGTIWVINNDKIKKRALPTNIPEGFKPVKEK